MPMRARNPLNEVAAPEIPVPVFGATGVLSAPGPGVFSPATALSGVVGTADGGIGVLVAVGGFTGVLVGRTGVLVGAGVGVLTMSGVQFVHGGSFVSLRLRKVTCVAGLAGVRLLTEAALAGV